MFEERLITKMFDHEENSELISHYSFFIWKSTKMKVFTLK